MKWSLFELDKLNNINEYIESYDIPETYSDVESIKDIKVVGKVIHINGEIKLELRITADAIKLCSYTLKEIFVPVDFEFDLLFGSSNDSDYPLTNPLELDEIILGNILAELPFRVFHESADPKEFEPKPKTHPAFEELAELLED